MSGSSTIVLTALRSLRRNLLRSTLTVLGIVIGIAAVIAMMELGNGSAQAIQRTIAAMGANTVMVLPGMAASAGVSFGAGTELTLTADDADAISSLTRSIKAAAPIIRNKGQLVYSNNNWVPNSINGTSPSFFVARDWRVVAGAQFTDRDVRAAAMVCLVGQTVVRELFHGTSPLGKEVRLQNVPLRVIGLLEAKGANMMGSDQDDVVVLPWSTLKYRITGSSVGSTALSATGTSSGISYPGGAASLYPRNEKSASMGLSTRLLNVDQILVGANSSETVDAAIAQITSLLRDRHRLREGAVNDFSIRNMTEMTKAMSATGVLMTRLLLVVALISLVVGGVGIMNIMLVTVTERTREIGLRMAVGARGRDILKQFLTEALVLCLIGGLTGLALGKGASFLVQRVLGWPVLSSPDVVIAALGVSGLVGLIFGFYPAWKGAQLDPIEALRYE